MRTTPAEEWQRLTKLYSEMSDGQLLELAESYGDLTLAAQPILRDEMKKRELGDPAAETQRPSGFAETYFRSSGIHTTDLPDDGVDLPRAYLCECQDSEQVNQLAEVLRREGIESFVDNTHAGIQGINESGIRRIFVPGDRLAQAREIVTRPIPQDIIDQSKVKDEDFALPACPKCGAPDPILESVDPVNSWSCDVCGATWSDPATAETSPNDPVS